MTPEESLKVDADLRINKNLRVCTTCEGILALIEVFDEKVWLFGHCKPCNKVFLLEGEEVL